MERGTNWIKGVRQQIIKMDNDNKDKNNNKINDNNSALMCR